MGPHHTRRPTRPGLVDDEAPTGWEALQIAISIPAVLFILTGRPISHCHGRRRLLCSLALGLLDVAVPLASVTNVVGTRWW